MWIAPGVILPDREIEFHAMRSQGAGGQNVNKVSTAIHLKVDLANCSLPHAFKEKVLRSSSHHLTAGGLIVIKAQGSRSQESNRKEALDRLKEFLLPFTKKTKRRIPTKIKASAKRQRLDKKKRHGEKKANRKKVNY